MCLARSWRRHNQEDFLEMDWLMGLSVGWIYARPKWSVWHRTYTTPVPAQRLSYVCFGTSQDSPDESLTVSHIHVKYHLYLEVYMRVPNPEA